MAKKRGAWERKIYYGVSGSTASTQIDDNVTDINVNHPHEFNEHTDRGDGSDFPKKTEQLVTLVAEVDFTMVYDDGDSAMTALLAAARAGTIKAIKVERRASGETEFDGDCYLEFESPGALKDGMNVTFTCHPTDDGGRDWTMG